MTPCPNKGSYKAGNSMDSQVAHPLGNTTWKPALVSVLNTAVPHKASTSRTDTGEAFQDKSLMAEVVHMYTYAG